MSKFSYTATYISFIVCDFTQNSLWRMAEEWNKNYEALQLPTMKKKMQLKKVISIKMIIHEM